MHLIIQQSRAYFNNGLIIPESYKKATNDLCDENDKMKQFIENYVLEGDAAIVLSMSRLL